VADENSILGTSGKDAIPFEYQNQEQQIARKRAMAQMMLQRGLAGPRQTQMFGIHASSPGIGEHVLSALQTYMGMKGQTAADAEQAGLSQQIQTAQQGDMSNALSTYAADPKEGIRQALLSKFGRVQGMGAEWSKNRQAATLATGNALAQGSPEAGARFIQGGDLESPIQDIPNAPPQFGVSPAGDTTVTNYDKTGKGITSFAPRPMQITQDVKTSAGVNEDAAKYFNYGGEGHKKGTTAVQNLRSTESLLSALDKNPTMGAGSEGIQFMRKVGETLGLDPTDKTPLTEMTAMQLGQRTFARLGGLGAQISDADREFVKSSNGSITNNPEALRRILLLSAYADMLEAKTINEGASDVQSRLPPNTKLPQHSYSFATGSQRNADDMERLFSKQGFAPAPVVEKPVPAGRLRRVK
jgi:hypothetical protein